MEKTFVKPAKSILFILYAIGFIFTLSYALPSYASSTFLAVITREQLVGAIYLVCAICTLIAFLFAPKLLKRYGNYTTTIVLAIINVLVLFGLAFSHNVYVILACFVAAYVVSTIISFCLDIFIEHNSQNKSTGRVRSIFLTSSNVAWLLSPWLAGILIGTDDYWKLFLVCGCIMIPTLFAMVYNLRGFQDPEYEEVKIGDAFRDTLKDKDISAVFMLSFLLQFFFAIMTIYAPIYLHEYIGFSWQTIGVMFTIMLLPFVLVQVPAGELADKRYGEKEMLCISFIIMAISSALIPLVGDKTIWIWTVLLFVSRVGGAIAQVMCDTYLFKKVGDRNVGIINLYRMMYAFSNIAAPIIATIFLIFFPFAGIFLLVGFFMLFGLGYGLELTDTL